MYCFTLKLDNKKIVRNIMFMVLIGLPKFLNERVLSNEYMQFEILNFIAFREK